jgi:NMD protein affecting ribosome stability and mRNA decay
MKFCQKCGGRVDTTSCIDDMCVGCINKSIDKTLVPIKEHPQGWECPKCGAVLSPMQFYCPFCAPATKFTNEFNPPSNWCGEIPIE